MKSADPSRIQLLSEPPFARLILVHGKQNVIDIPMMEEFARAMEHIES